MSRRSRAGQTRRLTRSWRTRASQSRGRHRWYRFYINNYLKDRSTPSAAFPARIRVWANAAQPLQCEPGMTSTTVDRLGARLTRRRRPRPPPPGRSRSPSAAASSTTTSSDARKPATRSSPARRSTRTRDRLLPRRTSRARLEARRRRGAARGDADRRGALLAHLVASPARVRRLHGRGLRARRPAASHRDRSPPSSPDAPAQGDCHGPPSSNAASSS